MCIAKRCSRLRLKGQGYTATNIEIFVLEIKASYCYSYVGTRAWAFIGAEIGDLNDLERLNGR